MRPSIYDVYQMKVDRLPEGRRSFGFEPGPTRDRLQTIGSLSGESVIQANGQSRK
jgi:hypothetical protein